MLIFDANIIVLYLGRYIIFSNLPRYFFAIFCHPNSGEYHTQHIVAR